MHNAKTHYDLIPATRAVLERAGAPYVIENVEGAPLHNPFMLCGTMFGLGCYPAELRRHRIFETNFSVSPLSCKHTGQDTIGIYGGHVRNRRRNADGSGQADFSKAVANESMGIDWMTLGELSQAIPPAYSEFIARQWLAQRLSTDVRHTQQLAAE